MAISVVGNSANGGKIATVSVTPGWTVQPGDVTVVFTSVIVGVMTPGTVTSTDGASWVHKDTQENANSTGVASAFVSYNYSGGSISFSHGSASSNAKTIQAITLRGAEPTNLTGNVNRTATNSSAFTWPNTNPPAARARAGYALGTFAHIGANAAPVLNTTGGTNTSFSDTFTTASSTGGGGTTQSHAFSGGWTISSGAVDRVISVPAAALASTGEYAGLVVFIPEADPVFPPTSLVATADSDSINLSWTAPATGATPTSYSVYRTGPNLLTGDDATFTSGTGSWAGTNATVSQDSALGQMVVTAVGGSSAITLSPAIPVTAGAVVTGAATLTTGIGVPTLFATLYFFNSSGSQLTSPSNVSATSGAVVNVTGTAPSGAASVRFRTSTGSTSSGDTYAVDNVSVLVTDVSSVAAPTTTYDDTTAVPGTEYTYTVRSVAAGVESSHSNTATATVSTGSGTQNFVLDDFNRASLGSDWVQGNNPAFTIVNNELAHTNSTSAVMRRVEQFPVHGAAGNFVEIEVKGVGDTTSWWIQPALYLPETMTGNSTMSDYYVAYMSQTAVSIRKKENNANTWTIMGSAISRTFTPGVYRFEDDGTDLVFYHEGVELLRVAKSLNPLSHTSRYAGLYVDPGPTYQNYSYENFKMGWAETSTPPAGNLLYGENLAAWRTARDNAATAPAPIVVIGDSVTEGYYAGTHLNRWINKAAKLLQKRFNAPSVPGGIGYIAPNAVGMGQEMNTFSYSLGAARPSAGTGATADPNGWGAGRRYVAFDSTSEWAQVQFYGTGFQLLFTRGTGTGQVGITLDDGAPVLFTTTDTYNHSGAIWAGPTTLTRGLHTVRVGHTSGSISILDGLMAFDGDHASGVTIFDAARSGMQSSDHNLTAIDNFEYVSIDRRDAALIIIALGYNDMSAGVAPTVFRDNIEKIIDRINGRGHAGSYLVLMTAKRGDQTQANFDTYVEAAKQAAAAKSAAFLNLDPELPTNPGTTSSTYYNDGVHPNAAGHLAIAEAIYPYLADEPLPPPSTGYNGFGIRL